MPSSGSDKLSASFSPSAIIVRPARYPSDLDELALVFQQSFWDDPWWRYLYLPKIDRASSEEARQAIETESLSQSRATIRRFLLEPRNHTFLAIDRQSGRIAGFAGWVASPTSAAHVRVLPFRQSALRFFLQLYDRLCAILGPRNFGWLLRLGPLACASIERQMSWTEFANAADARHIHRRHQQEGIWRLSLCGVLPAFGRRGIGQRLLIWGFGRADEDDRAMYISASSKGKGAYEKAGAMEIGRDICYPEDTDQGGWAEIVCRREKRSERNVDQAEKP